MRIVLFTPAARAVVGLLLLAGTAGAAPLAIVACAPGYPGTTTEAQPAMNAFAAALSASAGLKPDALAASYHETEAAGVARLRQPDAGFALVPLPFYLVHRQDLELTARLQIVTNTGAATEVWSLVGAKGRLRAPADLAGWQLLTLASYAPRFVGGVALAQWGAPPANVRLLPATSVLSGLRRAAATENVALLLDSAQAQGLPSLPFAQQLEVVTASAPLPGSLLCSVGRRVADARLRPLLAALAKLDAKPAGAAALAGLRMARFAPLDAPALAAAERAYAAAQ